MASSTRLFSRVIFVGMPMLLVSLQAWEESGALKTRGKGRRYLLVLGLVWQVTGKWYVAISPVSGDP